MSKKQFVFLPVKKTSIDINTMTPIRIEKLSKIYRSKRWQKITALDEVSFSIGHGEIFGFLGPNGAGKSTTIKILMGLVRATTGQALLFDRPSTEACARQKVGYLPENPALYDFLTGREYLSFVARIFHLESREIKKSAEAVLDRLDLRAAADRPIRSYSKGMVQRLGLGQALLHDPDVYVLDEPMSGLDPQGRALVKDIILDLGDQGKTVFFSTHITSDVEKICDRLAIICKGRILSVAAVDEVLSSSVENYRVLARNVSTAPAPCELFSSVSTGSLTEYQVSKDNLFKLIEFIKMQGGAIDIVEPHRLDLERYFLDTVAHAGK